MSGYGFSNALQNSNVSNSSNYNSSFNYNAKKPSASSNFHSNLGGGGRGQMVENKNKKKSNAKSKEEKEKRLRKEEREREREREFQAQMELQMERERQRENEIRAFREFSTGVQHKLPDTMQNRNRSRGSMQGSLLDGFKITPRGHSMNPNMNDSHDNMDYHQYSQPSGRYGQPLEALDHAPRPDMRARMNPGGLTPLGNSALASMGQGGMNMEKSSKKGRLGIAGRRM